MPPRFVYWTILIDNQPTAFRAHDRDDLLPTLTQLRRTNKDVVLKYFARGRVWDSPEQAREHYAGRQLEKRGRDWRPGGSHEDPRARFNPKNRKREKRPDRSGKQAAGGPAEARPVRKAWSPAKPPADRPWKKDRPTNHRPGGNRPWRADRPETSRRPREDQPRSSERPGKRPWSPKPAGGSRPPWKSPNNQQRPWRAKPSGPGGPPRRPWHKPPHPKKPKPPEDE